MVSNFQADFFERKHPNASGKEQTFLAHSMAILCGQLCKIPRSTYPLLLCTLLDAYHSMCVLPTDIRAVEMAFAS